MPILALFHIQTYFVISIVHMEMAIHMLKVGEGGKRECIMQIMLFFRLKVVGYWKRFRKWGFHGIYTFIVSKCHKVRRDARIRALSPKPYPTPIRGFTLAGTFSQCNSLSKVMRDLAYALKQIGIPYQILDLSEERNDVSVKELSEIITLQKDIHLCKYTHLLEMEDCPLPSDAPVKRSRICFWEFDTGLVEAFPSLLNCREIVGMSDYNCEVFRKLFPPSISVRKLLYPFRVDIPNLESPDIIRERYGIGKHDFVVFFNFDFGSSTDRKNPEGAMRAFSLAFKDIPGTKLVFKTMNSRLFKNRVDALWNLAVTLGIKDQFVTINNYISTADLYGLTNACDVYLSLHRGEGFGLGIAEAMAMGKPVVVTDYSSTTEFCNIGNALVVPYKMVATPQNEETHPNYLFVKKWAEPDVYVASKDLRLLYEDRSLRNKLGECGKAFVAEHFSIDRFKDSVDSFLDD